MSYNGWKNYETWNVALWLGNDGSNFDDVASEFVRDNYDPAQPSGPDLDSTYGDMAKYLENMIDEVSEDVLKEIKAESEDE